MATANETQVGGTHYAAAYQHWDLVWDTKMGYFPAQITKYISRHTKKNGLQDVQKALHFATKYAELLGATLAVGGVWDGEVADKYLNMYRIGNIHLGELELRIIKMCVVHHNVHTLERVKGLLQDVAGAYPGPGYVNQGGE